MPDTTPFKEAAARKLCEQITDGHLPGYCARCSKITEALEAYAAERVAETHANVRGAVAAHAAERDAAIARAEAAEAEMKEHKEHCAMLLDANNKAVVRYTAAEALAAERQMGLETDHAVYVQQLTEERERVRVLETTLNMIAESVIVSVAASPTEHRVTWGCGICQGEYHKSDRQEWYDHEAWYDHGAWCPRAKAAGGQEGHDENASDKPGASTPLTSCDFCGQHSWAITCPRSRCECGSSATVLARDTDRDGKVFRRCWRCGELKVWD